MLRPRTSLLLLVILLSACKNGSPDSAPSPALPSAEAVAMRAVLGGTRSGISERETRAVRSAEEFDALWRAHAVASIPPPSIPAIDWDREMVLACFLGTRPTGGYRVEIVRVERHGEDLRALVRERAPEPGSAQTTALTQPFHLVAVPRTSGRVEFDDTDD